MSASPQAEIVTGYRSDVAQALFHVEGSPFSLADYPTHLAIYDGDYAKLLLKMARQTAKSTAIACFMIAECIGIPHFKCFYISPSKEQTNKFSHSRVGKILSFSPDVKRSFVGPASVDNVFHRMLTNGSEMAFSYAWDDADRTRGVSADRTAFDEVQDILYDEVIPVIEESMGNSKYGPFSMYAGTPKTSENTIEVLWQWSSQTEWCMKCSGCGKRTYIDSVKALGKKGPICLSCGKDLNPRDGIWLDTAAGKQSIKGFHVSQPMMPRNVPAAWPTSHPMHAKAQRHWEELLSKMEHYGETKFLNECIAVSTSTGVKLLTKEILESLCDERFSLTRLPVGYASKAGIVRVTAGVDWSGGGGEVKGSEGLFKSRTVLHIWGQTDDGRLRTLFYKIFPNAHATGWVDEIVELCNAWGVQMIVGDEGEGALANAILRERLGEHRVMQVRYMALSKPVDWKPEKMCFHVDRTTMIDNFARFLMLKQAIYGPLVQMKPAIDDILSVYENVTQAGRKIWQHPPNIPDDSLHAQLFGWFAWRLLCKDMAFY